jgi:hypothetical protein
MPDVSKATIFGGTINKIADCYVIIGKEKIVMQSLPDISDSKNATYNDETAMGRASPIKTFAHADARQIGMAMHFFVTTGATGSDGSDTTERLINIIRTIQSAAYPREEGGNAFVPPPICKLKCGELLANKELCVILKSYSIKYPTDVVWDAKSLVPIKVDIDTTWEVVYKSSDLPGSDKIQQFGTNG